MKARRWEARKQSRNEDGKMSEEMDVGRDRGDAWEGGGDAVGLCLNCGLSGKPAARRTGRCFYPSFVSVFWGMQSASELAAYVV